jgi:formylglycine-generating enzyme required for sulfatase activity
MCLGLITGLSACTYWVADRTCGGAGDCLAGELCSNAGFCVQPEPPFDGGDADASTDAGVRDGDSLCVDDSACQAPVARVGLVERTETSITLNWSLVDPGDLPIQSMSLCAQQARTRSADPVDGCRSVDPDVFWDQPFTWDELQQGTSYAFRLTLVTSARSHEFTTPTFATLPAAPDWIDASDGTNANGVLVDWEPVPGAEGYIVWRDGIALTQVTAPPWLDTEAGTGGAPLAPEVQASDDIDWFWVDVQWSQPATEPGPAHDYAIQTTSPLDRSAISAADTGYSSGPPIQYYELCIDNCESWQRVTGRQYIDRDSPLRLLKSPRMEVSRGTEFGSVSLRAVPTEGEEPEPTNYAVRAVNAAGTGPAGTDSGYRNIGPGGITITFTVHYAWDGRKLERPDVAPVIVSEDFEHQWLPSESARTYSILLVYRSVGAIVAASPVTFGYAAECDADHPCAPGIECSRGVCSWPGLVPFFASQVYRGLRPDLFEYQPGDNRGLSQITYDFDIQPYETTQGEWLEVWGANPAAFNRCGLDCPVENVTWYSAVAYANRLSELNGLTPCYTLPEDCSGDAAEGTLTCNGVVEMVVERENYFTCGGFRLPTEFEWEIAAGGYREFPDNLGLGPPQRYDCEEPDTVFDAFAAYCANAALHPDTCAAYGLSESCCGTWPVGLRADNGWGVYDAIGNVAEWTWGERGAFASNSSSNPDLNPLFWPIGADRVVRGGSFDTDPRLLGFGVRTTRPATWRGPDTGFRLVRTRP